MSRYDELFILNNPEPIVIVSWRLFERLLESIPKRILIKEIAEDVVTQRKWREMDKEQIIGQIFINNESMFPT